MRPIHHRSVLLLTLPGLLWLAGCDQGGKGAPIEDEGSQPEASSDTGEDPGATSMAGTGSTSSDEDEGGSTFIVEPPDPIPGCDVWAQDCPVGEKCMPWANDGGNSWNALKCVEIDDNPGEPGDPCHVEGGGVSGIDDCAIGSMCWDVDPETSEGVCVAMCTGDQAAPICEDPSTSCIIVNDGVLNLCLPDCDPLLQDCEDGQACYPVNGTFTCAPDASGPELGVFGDPCEFINACDAGLFCANASAVPGCGGSAGCCSDFCDLDADFPEDDCSGAAEGQECLPFFDEGDAPPGAEAFGACALPET